MEVVGCKCFEGFISKAAEGFGVGRATDAGWRQIDYIWNYKTNIKGLRDEVEKLEAEIQTLEQLVAIARRKGEEIFENVKLWLKNSKEAIEKANKILEDNEAASKNCFCISGCPNLKTRHRFGRRAKKQATVVDGVTKDGKFDSIGYTKPLPGGVTPDKDYEDFQSRVKVLKDVVEALKDADLNLIGLYGLSGVGKTTLAKKVGQIVIDEGTFKEVVLADVTTNVDVSRIQREIGDALGLGFKVETPRVRAKQLSERIKQEEKILIILDDIWEIIKLEDIGIPFGSDHKGCKVLMTSRNQNALQQMQAQKQFQLGVLEEEDAWHLFEKKAFENKVDSSLEDTAKEVAKRCAGLPVLIGAVAIALKGKELAEWRDALSKLKRFDNDGIEAKVKSTLNLSYSTLSNEEKFLFRLCGQLRPQFMSARSLLRYSIGLGLFNGCNTVRQSRDRLTSLLKGLKKACLLLEGEGDDDQHFKMHDTIHGFASSTASNEDQVLIVADDKDSEEWQSLQQYKAISLQSSKIPELSQQFECPDLESFTLYNYKSLKIPDSLFSMMKKLKVLFLSNVKLSPISLSPEFLENLQTLCLDCCDFDDIAAIGELKKLRVLSLVGSSIDQLPQEVRKLTRLQLLDLSRCYRLDVIPSGVLSCLTKLEELYVGNSSVKWKSEEHCQSSNASLAELKHLPKLVSLELLISDAEMIPEDLFSKKLERFRITIGDDCYWDAKHETSKTLKLKLNESIELERVQSILKRVKPLLEINENLYLENLKGVTSVLYKLDTQGFPQLKHLHIRNSQDVRYILDCLVMDDRSNAFQNLVSLVLENLKSLEKICRNQPMAGPFSNLRKLKVRNCDALKNLFSFSTFKSLKQLEEINVNSCKVLEGIVAEENGDNEVLACIKVRNLTLENLPAFGSFFCQLKEQEPATVNTGCREITAENHSKPSLLFGNKADDFGAMCTEI